LKYWILTSIILLSGTLTSTAFAEEQTEECIFTGFLEKSWMYYAETPWIRGSVINCDTAHTVTQRLLQQDRIHVQILTIDGQIIGDNLRGEYDYHYDVYREGNSQGNFFNDKVPSVTINPNEYFFYMPSINSLHFDHRGIYQIQISYNEHVKILYFAVLNPNVWYEDPEYCVDINENIEQLILKIKNMKKQSSLFLETDRVTEYKQHLKKITELENDLKNLKDCKYY
jgi:hypothetical protein